MLEFTGKYGKALVTIDVVDQATISQIYEFLNCDVFTNQIIIMPDTHAGSGAVIGFTMPMTDKIIPNVVGVDINCGMLAINVGKNILSSLSRRDIDTRVRHAVPFGTNTHKKDKQVLKKYDIFRLASSYHRDFVMKYNLRFGTSYNPLVFDYTWLETKCTEIKMDIKRTIDSLGTLGSGNHFIELGKSESTKDYWFTIHSGSRQFGLKVANYWQKKAGKGSLAYLTGDGMFGYLTDVIFASAYAQINRVFMGDLVLEACELKRSDIKDSIWSNHNFIDWNDFIIRKGAIRSYVGERMVIPFNMEDGILLCEGKSNPDWNFSAPHGAGRICSRTEAKRKLSLNEAEQSMKKKDVYCSKLPLDEAKGSYKDPAIIENAIGPTATIIDRLKPVLAMKD